MTDIRQSLKYTEFMRSLGWQVEKINSTYIFLKKIPILGNFAKIPRFNTMLSLEKINNLINKYRIFRLKIAPNFLITSREYLKVKSELLNSGFKIDNDPFLPTATIRIDISKDENELFKVFSEAKRRAVRKALKLGVFTKQSDNINKFITLRKKQHFPFGLLYEKETLNLWKSFYPSNAALLLAYNKVPPVNPWSFRYFNKKNTSCLNSKFSSKPLAGILLLFYKGTAYYWLASSCTLGKKLYAPTLLVWEAIKLSREKGKKIFDFEGIYDDRFPKLGASWKGFTKFKKGFGGKVVNFMENYHR